MARLQAGGNLQERNFLGVFDCHLALEMAYVFIQDIG